MCKPVNLTCPLCHSTSFTLAEVNTSYWVYTIENGKLVDPKGREVPSPGPSMVMGDCECGYTWVVDTPTVNDLFPQYKKPVVRKLPKELNP